GVAVGCCERVDELGVHVGEHDLVAGVVQGEADEAAPDVPGAEVDGLHDSLTSDSRACSSAAVAASTSRCTASSSEKMMAILERMSRCSFSMPAMPTTNRVSSPF